MAESESAAPNGSGPVPAGDAAGKTAADMAPNDSISADEIALYDRQIRLWGLQAQEKIRTANVLILSMNALGNEVAKNLVLAGVGGVTVVDDVTVTENDLGAQFLLSESDIGKNRAEAVVPALQALNPRVEINALNLNPIMVLPEFVGFYSLTIANCLPYPALIDLNIKARFANRPFYAAGIHGLFGYLFADLVSHDYVIEREKSNVPVEVGKAETSTRSILNVSPKSSGTENGSDARPTEVITKREVYTPLQLANTSPLPPYVTDNRRRLRAVPPLLTGVRALWEFESNVSPTLSMPDPKNPGDLAAFTKLAKEKHQELMLPMDTLRSDFLRSFIQSLGTELPPVAAWLGGQLAQECVNVLRGREQPIQNFALFDGDEMTGRVYALQPMLDPSTMNGIGMGGPTAGTVPPLPMDGLMPPADGRIMGSIGGGMMGFPEDGGLMPPMQDVTMMMPPMDGNVMLPTADNPTLPPPLPQEPQQPTDQPPAQPALNQQPAEQQPTEPQQQQEPAQQEDAQKVEDKKESATA